MKQKLGMCLWGVEKFVLNLGWTKEEKLILYLGLWSSRVELFLFNSRYQNLCHSLLRDVYVAWYTAENMILCPFVAAHDYINHKECVLI